jgi:hypothetical protein
MEGTRFDQLTRAVAASGSRRRVLGVVLAGVLGSLRIRTTSADDPAPVIAEAGGGDDNLATVVDPVNGGHADGHDHDHDRDHKQCQPKSQNEACEDRCGRVVNDGCGGEIRCTCPGDKVCAWQDGVCCHPERVCEERSICCPAGETCGPGDACCPNERLCLRSDECCAAGMFCTPGGGTCCVPEDTCIVGGAPQAACCTDIGTCINGVCLPD